MKVKKDYKKISKDIKNRSRKEYWHLFHNGLEADIKILKGRFFDSNATPEEKFKIKGDLIKKIEEKIKYTSKNKTKKLYNLNDLLKKVKGE